jgi:hypothetical protein
MSFGNGALIRTLRVLLNGKTAAGDVAVPVALVGGGQREAGRDESVGKDETAGNHEDNRTGSEPSGSTVMMTAAKDWATLLGFDKEQDERTMASRARVMAKTLAYLEAHYADPDGPRPSEAVVMEFTQFLLLAESMEPKGRGGKFRELYEEVVQLHLHWDERDRDASFAAIAKKVAMLKGVLSFCDAWQGTETIIPRRQTPREPAPLFDDADVKTRIVRPSHMRP